MKKTGAILLVVLGIFLGGRILKGPDFDEVPGRSPASVALKTGALKSTSVAAPVQNTVRSSVANSATNSAAINSNNVGFMTPIDALIRDLRRLQTCFQIECGYPRSDAKSYDFALGQDIKKALLALQEKVEEQKSVDPLLAQVARDFLADPDGHVKEAALHLLATQPTSAESLETILVHVIAEYDSELIEQALLELGRYQNVHEVERINEALAQAMTHGAPFVSQKIAENIEPFIQDQSYAFFATLSRRLTNGSQTYKQLHSALESFSRRQTGG